ncbi:unnamed protein product [Bursaphelenchus okinawaensis]|uniref:Uncharacterized protein n=1 Tax=Bursaphelenchus okinawaensis TaxID=465554 RepID=A0A811LP90_9BILA|nr:unnamed protein product [Bursaphelenchus okinawaensis]CAG9127029.1 unnamed protein product [Bursaphelenchus okinawaensis]
MLLHLVLLLTVTTAGVTGQADEHTQGSILENWGGTLQQKTYNGDYRTLNILSHDALPKPLADDLQRRGYIGLDRVRSPYFSYPPQYQQPQFPTYNYGQFQYGSQGFPGFSSIYGPRPGK